jgi:hypothetical protein
LLVVALAVWTVGQLAGVLAVLTVVSKAVKLVVCLAVYWVAW